MIPNNIPSFSYGRFIAKNAIKQLPPVTRRTLVTWSKLEPLPYNEDLTAGLQAQIADPLWMIARQWQFGEFEGEDAGTPIWSKLDGEIGRLSTYRPGLAADSIDYSHEDLPVEVLVEQEHILSLHPRLKAEAGEHLIRLLAGRGIQNTRSALRGAFPLDIKEEDIWSAEADTHGLAWRELFAHRAIDGFAIKQALPGHLNEQGKITSLPEELSFLSDEDESKVFAALQDWLDWYALHVIEPETSNNEAWLNQRQEYKFSMSAFFENREVVLGADEYTDGDLDWHSFRVQSSKPNNQGSPSVFPETFSHPPVLPAPVRYPGMPADRYWEFEDARVNLGYMEAGPTDLARMVLAEFGLVYSNDWFVIPVDMPVGSLFNVGSLQVRDTFGETSEVKPARNFDGARWTMFSLSGSEKLPNKLKDLYFLAPTIPFRLEGDPLEEVKLFRDEMANMSWAVERTVQGASGIPIDRNTELSTSSAHQRVEAAEVTADLIYRLMTPVADNWLPFVPVPADTTVPLFNFSIGLERRTLLKALLDGSLAEIHPRGILMRSDLSKPVEDEPPLRLFEEEVPREGAHVRRSFQCSRWIGGKRLVWVGRSKKVGRGEGSSGLRFDVSLFTDEKVAELSQKG